MPWFVSKAGGQLRRQASSPGAGWVLIPGATDSMNEQQAKQQLVDDAAHGVFGSSVGNGLRKAAGALPGLSGVAAIGDFFSRLTEGSTWLRIAEGVLGIVLIAVGLARITHAVPIATKIAGAVA